MKRSKRSKTKNQKRIQDKINKPKVQEKFILSLSGSDMDKAQLITKSNVWGSAAGENKVTKFAFFTKGDSKKVRYWMTPKLFIMFLNIPNPPINENYFISHKFYSDKYVSFRLNSGACSNLIYFMDKVNDVLSKNEFFERILLLTENSNLDPYLYEILDKSTIQNRSLTLDLKIAIPSASQNSDQLKYETAYSSEYSATSSRVYQLTKEDGELDYSTTQKSQNQISENARGLLDDSYSSPSLLISSPSSSDSKNNSVFKAASQMKDLYLESTSQSSAVSISSSFKSRKTHRSTSVKPRKRDNDNDSKNQSNRNSINSAASRSSQKSNRNSISSTNSRSRRNASVRQKGRSNRNSISSTNQGDEIEQNLERNQPNSNTKRSGSRLSSEGGSRNKKRINSHDDQEPETRYSMDSGSNHKSRRRYRNGNEEEDDREPETQLGNSPSSENRHSRSQQRRKWQTIQGSRSSTNPKIRSRNDEEEEGIEIPQNHRRNRNSISANSGKNDEIRFSSTGSRSQNRNKSSKNNSPTTQTNHDDDQNEYYEDDEIDTRYSMDSSNTRRRRRHRTRSKASSRNGEGSRSGSRSQKRIIIQENDEPETIYTVDDSNNHHRSHHRQRISFNEEEETGEEKQNHHRRQSRNESEGSVNSKGSKSRKRRSNSTTQKVTRNKTENPQQTETSNTQKLKPSRRSNSINNTYDGNNKRNSRFRTSNSATNSTRNSPKHPSLNGREGRHISFASDHVRYNFDCSSLLSNSDNTAKRKRSSVILTKPTSLLSHRNNDENSSSTDNFVFDIEEANETNTFENRPDNNRKQNQNIENNDDDSVKEISVLKIVSDGTSSITKNAPELKINGSRKAPHFSDSGRKKKIGSVTQKIIRKNNSSFTQISKTTKFSKNNFSNMSIDGFDNPNLALSPQTSKSKFLNESGTPDERTINSDDTSSDLIQESSQKNDIVDVSDSIEAALPSADVTPNQAGNRNDIV